MRMTKKSEAAGSVWRSFGHFLRFWWSCGAATASEPTVWLEEYFGVPRQNARASSAQRKPAALPYTGRKVFHQYHVEGSDLCARTSRENDRSAGGTGRWRVRASVPHLGEKDDVPTTRYL
jgi:hypothetical protein